MYTFSMNSRTISEVSSGMSVYFLTMERKPFTLAAVSDSLATTACKPFIRIVKTLCSFS